jgi:hypothetical protein
MSNVAKLQNQSATTATFFDRMPPRIHPDFLAAVAPAPAVWHPLIDQNTGVCLARCSLGIAHRAPIKTRCKQ